MVGFYRCFWGMINTYFAVIYSFGRGGSAWLWQVDWFVVSGDTLDFRMEGSLFFLFFLLLLEFCLFVDFLIGCCFVICGFFVWVIYSEGGVGGNGVFTCFQILDTKTTQQNSSSKSQ